MQTSKLIFCHLHSLIDQTRLPNITFTFVSVAFIRNETRCRPETNVTSLRDDVNDDVKPVLRKLFKPKRELSISAERNIVTKTIVKLVKLWFDWIYWHFDNILHVKFSVELGRFLQPPFTGEHLDESGWFRLAVMHCDRTELLKFR